MTVTIARLREFFVAVWLVDFEFFAPAGERPTPLCMVARDILSDRLLRVWLHENDDPVRLPFDVTDSLYVAYYASAEMGCHLALDWPMPDRVVDLFAEFRNVTNGRGKLCGNGLLGALAHYGLGAIDASEKSEMRDLAMRGGSYSEPERVALLDYCQSDVDALARLFCAMLPNLDFERALLRGQYMKAAACMEWNGIPVDVEMLALLRLHWSDVQGRLIDKVNDRYGVYVPRTSTGVTSASAGMRFSSERFADYLKREGLPWPRLESGVLALDDATFRDMAARYPDQIGPLRELRSTLGKLRLNDLSVGSDGRNRCVLSAFQSKTGRNQPSNSRFIFGPSCWIRSLIQPRPGYAIAYIDWSQQEFGIAAALSSDVNMMDAYLSGDPYLTFAKQAGAVPHDATKQSHPKERGQFKVCALAVQYGMGAHSLAQSLGEPPIVARELLRLHRKTYPDFWRWSEGAVDSAMLYRKLHTVFGWKVHVDNSPNPRSLANFPCQANGAEMLRLACCLASERDITVCAPVHDAMLIESRDCEIDDDVWETQEAMREASRIVLDGFELRSDAEIVVSPNRYTDERGVGMWETVRGILDELAGGLPDVS